MEALTEFGLPPAAFFFLLFYTPHNGEVELEMSFMTLSLCPLYALRHSTSLFWLAFGYCFEQSRFSHSLRSRHMLV
jgi:hypothetical protein